MNNLNVLHQKIDSIISIEGISEQPDSSFIIHYANNQLPNQNQLDSINNILANWPLDNKKLESMSNLDNYWNIISQNGWSTPYGWKLGLTINDVTLLTGAFVLAKEANGLGLNNPVSIIDTDGFSHELSLQDLTMLMLQYGNARAQLSSKYANVKAQINACVSLEELDNIDINTEFNNA